MINKTLNQKIYLGERKINSLGAGVSNTANTQFTVPKTVNFANYHIAVYIDSSDRIKESNESNNIRASSTMKIINPADMNKSKPIYITSDNIKGTAKDNVQISNIITGLVAMGLQTPVNYGIGPNKHYSIIKNSSIPSNALIVNIYGGFCAGTIWEMNSTAYKHYLANRTVLSIWINSNVTLNSITFLPRAHDDYFTPLYNTKGGFPDYIDNNHNGIFEPGPSQVNNNIIPKTMVEKDGLDDPAKFLTANGYHYLSLLNYDINSIVDFIYTSCST